tara:strand:+ start:1504 stop:4329 length:2826 start_codon:yes stop_codon:yes gene_type:complete
MHNYRLVVKNPNFAFLKVYYISSPFELPQEKLEGLVANPLVEEVECNKPEAENPHFDVEILFLKGMTDNLAASLKSALEIVFECRDAKVHSGKILRLEKNNDLSQEQILKSLGKNDYNPLLHGLHFQSGEKLAWPDLWKSTKMQPPVLKEIPLDSDIFTWSKERQMGLSQAEVDVIREHFQKLGRNPTDCELEVLAQTWSEHCKHKIFAADIDYKESADAPKKIGDQKVSSLFKTFIKSTVKPEHQHCISVFHDNAGVVHWNEDVDLCIKVETHNSPSALDPFSGAITGILGVQRDIMGTGKGAKPVANMDVFCIGNEEDFPAEGDDMRPKGLFRAKEILEGVHHGVREGGNHMGVPTVNGSFQVHPSFAGKPLIYVGSIGAMPAGKDFEKKEIAKGDLIYVGGGRLGKDGIHGATFSSQNMEGKIASTVVQIGDPITQKRLLDFTLEARDQGLISAITDNGAGGISSSVGEMAERGGGARIDISKHRLKTEAMDYYEMIISESQERMTYIIKPENQKAFEDLALRFGVEVDHLGEFTANGRFEVFYQDKKLVDLDLEFLHEAYPKLHLQGEWQGPAKQDYWYRRTSTEKASEVLPVLQRLLASPNIQSKEKWVRQYDMEVGGATTGKPFTGEKQDGVNDQAILQLKMYGSKKKDRVVLGHGFAAKTAHLDSYYMASLAVDECLRNLIACGTHPEKIVLVDNFCWPNPMSEDANTNSRFTADLVRACYGMHEYATSFGLPFISGKDSMKNTWRGKSRSGKDLRIDVEPSLLISGMGYLADEEKHISSDFQAAGDLVYHLQFQPLSLRASEFSYYYQAEEGEITYADFAQLKEKYIKLHKAIQSGMIASCHDVSDGGMLIALIESLIGAKLGLQSKRNFDMHDFAEGFGSFVVSIAPKDQLTFESVFAGEAQLLGNCVEEYKVFLPEENWSMQELENLWRLQ